MSALPHTLATDTHRKLCDALSTLRALHHDMRDRDPVAFDCLTRVIRDLDTARQSAEAYILTARARPE